MESKTSISQTGQKATAALPPTKKVTFKTVAYWFTTAIICFELVNGALWDFDVVNKSFVHTVLTHLGYPAYLATILGTGKLAAAVAMLLPRLPLTKEWAYAGTTFIFCGAIASHAVVGDGIDVLIWPFLFGAFTLASWSLRPLDRRLA